MGGDHLRLDAPLPDLWDDEHAASLDGPGLLLYRSNLLGSDLRVTNFGGGNTSAKLAAPDPLTGATTNVLWVKGSGGDIGSMKLDGFSTLYLDKLLGLRSVYRGLEHEDEMVPLYNHCTFNLNPRATSIDTPLHGFVPHPHVDHVHADSVIAIAASENAEALTREIFGGELGFLPWQRPGFDLGLKLGAMAEANPKMKGVVLGGHGLFTWGPTAKDCYRTTLEMINRAARWLSDEHAWRGLRRPALRGPAAGRASRRRREAPARHSQAHFERRAQGRPLHGCGGGVGVRQFPRARSAWRRSGRPAPIISCAPRSARWCCRSIRRRAISTLSLLPSTRILPTIAPTTRPTTGAANGPTRRRCAIRTRSFIWSRASACCRSPRTNRPRASPREFYVNAINVMRGASGVSRYVGLKEQEAFDIEYWLLEEAKLQRLPKPKSLAGRVALVTGGAGGIGQAIAARLMREGACVVLADIDAKSLDATVADFGKRFGKDVVAGVQCRRDERACGRGGVPRDGPRLRRDRHRRRQRGHRLGGAVRGYFARALEPQLRDPRNRVFPLRAGGLPDHERSGSRRQPSSSSRRRTRSRPRPARRPIAAPRRRRFILRAASRSRARRTAFAPTRSIRTRCCAAPRSGRVNGGRSGPPRTR